MKDKYLDIMEAALSAYSSSDILSYYEHVRSNGITEHGYPRLVASIGILISKGRRKELLALFLDMMNLAADCIPRAQADCGNDYAVREIVTAILELEKTDLVSKERTAKWRESLGRIDLRENYAKSERYGATVYCAASEYMRACAGIADVADIDAMLLPHMSLFDENGMYIGAGDSILDDIAVRAHLAFMLESGYSGKCAEKMEEMLDKSAELTARMQSVTGELPFGGRSNQMIFNDAYLAALMEYYAARYKMRGELERAARFKAGADLAAKCILRFLSKEIQTHVKNYYPRESMIGCEGDAHFNKYMISIASFAYLAYAFSDDGIEPSEAVSICGGYSALTGVEFHKFFVNNGGYFLEFDMNADPKCDATGLGRIQGLGAPKALALSVPFPASPCYKTEKKNASPMALTSMADEDVEYCLAEVKNVNSAIYSCMNVLKDGKAVSSEKYTVDESGVKIIIDSEGDAEYNIPAFMFDGRIYTNTTLAEHALRVYYKGYIVEYYCNDAQIFDTGATYQNRNGVYRLYKVHSKHRLSLQIRIFAGSPLDI